MIRVSRVLGVAAVLFASTSVVHGQAPCCRDAGLEIAERYRVEGLDERRFTHEHYWGALGPILESDRIRVTPLGESIEGRAINALTIGAGPVTVLLWSQMHGDESTATMSLADLLHWFAAGPEDDDLRLDLAERLTIVMVPMLNPDGAERFIRENAIGVDINRDALRTSTPEARILKGIRDSLDADFGFNLHDQNVRSAGEEGDLVAVALLAPAADEERSWGDVRQRARGVAAVISDVLATDLGGQVARYDDEFTPRAFGDNMQAWGTSTVLIESGILRDDPQKQALRRHHVVAILSALHAIATRGYEEIDTAAYDELPMNVAVDFGLLIMGGTVVVGEAVPVRTDIGIRFDDWIAGNGPTYGAVGDLRWTTAIDTIDAAGRFIRVEPGDNGILKRGDPTHLTIREGAGPNGEVVRVVE